MFAIFLRGSFLYLFTETYRSPRLDRQIVIDAQGRLG
jgi:hypothetical protein